MATRYVMITLEETTSTQDEAGSRFRGDPVLVVASRQRAGRGRRGRRWRNAPRALAASLAWSPAWPHDTWPRIALVAGLASLDLFGGELKWPNDLVIANRKVGGILSEASDGVVVVGLGVNLWWPDPPDGFGAVYETDPGTAEAADLAGRWADLLLGRLDEGPDGWGVEEYRAACSTIGSQVEWVPDGSGRAVGIDERGRLLVDTGGVLVALSSGDVSEVRALR
jgi:BirA family biotin operon repressor/biotin-[acetyl-CoA-carboxylase] ligase